MKSMWTKKEFTTSGTWVCPAGVTVVIVYGAGGGGGGAGGGGTSGNGADGYGGYGGDGGLGNPLIGIPVTVVPNTSYTVTIGAGGIGGLPGLASTGNPVGFGRSGGDGSDTTFGALATFKGARGGWGGGSTTTQLQTSATPLGQRSRMGAMRALQAAVTVIPSGGGYRNASLTMPAVGGSGHLNWGNSTSNAGATGTTSGALRGGTGGGGGMDGIQYPGIVGTGGLGGTGGKANTATPSTTGGTAAANSAAGGGGGGGNYATSIAIGRQDGVSNGGDGGSGFLVVTWVE